MAAETIIEDDRWAGSDLERLAERALAATLGHLGLGADWDVAVLGCDDARIAALNTDHRGRDAATNVLSWPSAERGAVTEGDMPGPPSGGPELGDIAVAFETCLREAREAGIAIEDHVLHLLVHGILHLLGYDHVRDGDGDLMESTETAILAALGVPDPYRADGHSGPG